MYKVWATIAIASVLGQIVLGALLLASIVGLAPLDGGIIFACLLSLLLVSAVASIGLSSVKENR